MQKLMVILLVLIASMPIMAKDIPWADSIIHTGPVLERGLGPEMVSSGYEIVTLTDIGRNGEPIDSYTAWMSGRSGGKVWVKFRPGEGVEAKCTGTRQLTLNSKTYCVKTMEAKRIVRCGNPTQITFYVWEAVSVEKTRTITVVEPARTQLVEVKFDVLPVRVKVEPIEVNVAPIRVEVDLRQAAAAPQQVTVNNWNLMPQQYGSAQMMGVYGATYCQSQLLGVSTTSPTRINISANNVNNNANANTNVNANTNTINIGKGSATGKTDASGGSTAGAGNGNGGGGVSAPGPPPVN